MRHPLPALLAAAPLLALPSPAVSVTIDWVAIGNPGNAGDPERNNCFGALFTNDCGSVAYDYYVAKYEVTNTQYAEFLNAKAAVSDPRALYSTNMATDAANGGIVRSGSPGSFTYSVKPGFEHKPVNYVSFYDSARFANWMNNGQGNADTETGSYTLLGAGPTPTNGATVTRNAGAQIALANENEWYKAAYYDPFSGGYLDYPTGTDTQTTCSGPTASANHANCNNAVGHVTDVGSYPGSASLFGALDLAGNIQEWTEYIFSGARLFRSGSFIYDASYFEASLKNVAGGSNAYDTSGVRLVLVNAPEPGAGLLLMAGLLALAARRQRRAWRLHSA